MGKKVSVAIATHSGKYSLNYGSMLQATAMQKMLEDIGCEPITIDFIIYDYDDYVTRAKATEACLHRGGLRCLCTYLRFGSWFKSRIRMSKRISLQKNEALIEYVKRDVDLLLTGSDCVWHNLFIMPIFLWDYDELDGIPRISYAASADSDFDAHNLKYGNFENAIKKFDSVSVREESFGNELKQLGVYPKCVLDPTLAVDESFWYNNLCRRLIKEDYVVCYFLNGPEAHKILVESIKDRFHVDRVIYINTDFVDSFTVHKASFYGPDEYRGSVGIKQFLSLLRYSSCVCTDSYHGICLSISFRKPFFYFPRSESYENGTGWRVGDLFRMLDLPRRVVIRNSDIDEMDEIDYDKVYSLLCKRRDESMSFLSEAIEKALGKTDHQCEDGETIG